MYLALESEFQDYSTTDDIDLVNNIFKDAIILNNNIKDSMILRTWSDMCCLMHLVKL